MDRLVTSTRFGPSGASSSKQKALNNYRLGYYEVIENQSRNGMCVKCVHCKGVLKMHVGLELASSLASGASLSEPPSLVCIIISKKILYHPPMKGTSRPTTGS